MSRAAGTRIFYAPSAKILSDVPLGSLSAGNEVEPHEKTNLGCLYNTLIYYTFFAAHINIILSLKCDPTDLPIRSPHPTGGTEGI